MNNPMNNIMKTDLARTTTFGMMLVVVSFFLAQTYPIVFTTDEGNIVAAFFVLLAMMCGKQYGITSAVIVGGVVFVMRYFGIGGRGTPIIEGNKKESKADIAKEARNLQFSLYEADSEAKKRRRYDDVYSRPTKQKARDTRNDWIKKFDRAKTRFEGTRKTRGDEVYKMNFPFDSNSGRSRNNRKNYILRRTNITDLNKAYGSYKQRYNDQRAIKNYGTAASKLVFPVSDQGMSSSQLKSARVNRENKVNGKYKQTNGVKKAKGEYTSLLNASKAEIAVEKDRKTLRDNVMKLSFPISEKDKTPEQVTASRKSRAMTINEAKTKDAAKKKYDTIKGKSDAEFARQKCVTDADTDMKALLQQIAESEKKVQEQRDLAKKTVEDAAARAKKIAEQTEAARIDEQKKLDAEKKKQEAEQKKLEAEQKKLMDEAEALRIKEAERLEAERRRKEDALILQQELEAERQRVLLAEKLAEQQRIKYEQERRGLAEQKESQEEDTLSLRERLTREVQRRSAAEESLLSERERVVTVRNAETRRCREAKEKADKRRALLALQKKIERQKQAAAERKKQEEEASKKERQAKLLIARRKELVDERLRVLRKLKTHLVDERQTKEEVNRLNQVDASKRRIVADDGRETSMYSSSPASLVGSDGMPSQFSLENLYAGRSSNAYLGTRPDSDVYVDRVTLGGYVGPMNMGLYRSAKPKIGR